MQSLIQTNQLAAYSVKEFGPIIVALAFVLALGGVVAAAIVLCGWRGAKNVSIDISRKSVEFLCR